MNVTVLAYVEDEGSKDCDAVMGQVVDALGEGGHRASILRVHGDVGKLIAGIRLRMPLFVKPLRNDASMGIDAKSSLVRNAQELIDRVAHIHREFDDAALAEEYIEGREFYVGVLGNQEPVAFPPIEMDFSGLPDGAPRILDARAKFDESSPEYAGTRAVIAELDDVLKARLQKVALDAYRGLR